MPLGQATSTSLPLLQREAVLPRVLFEFHAVAGRAASREFRHRLLFIF